VVTTDTGLAIAAAKGELIDLTCPPRPMPTKTTNGHRDLVTVHSYGTAATTRQCKRLGISRWPTDASGGASGRRLCASALDGRGARDIGSLLLARVNPQLSQRPPIDASDATAPPHGRPMAPARNGRACRIKEPHILHMHIRRPR
jgi:hypothetical protein